MRALAGRARRRSAPAKPGSAAVGQPVVVADPGDDARGQHLALPGERRPAPFAVRTSRRPDGRPATAAEGSPQSRRSRSQAKPFRASSHSAPAPARRHGGSSDSGHHGADAAAGQQLARDQALADRRIARPRIGRHGEEAARACRSPRSGNRAPEPSSQRPKPRLSPRPASAGRGEERSGRDGRRPPKAHRAVARLRRPASSVFCSLARRHLPPGS